MNTIWHSLLWKEWREHRWKLATLAAVFVLVPVVSSLSHHDAIFGVVSAWFLIAIPVASMSVATNIAAGEQGRGTSSFLLALPVAPARPAAAKLVWAAITVVAPVLLAIVAVALWNWALNPPEVAAEAIAMDTSVYKTSWLIDDWYLARAVGGSLAAVSIVLWIAAAGVNCSDEVRAAAIGLLVAVGCWAALVYLGYATRTEGGAPDWWFVLTAGAAGGPALSQPGAIAAERAKSIGPVAALWPYAVVALCSHTALGAWFLARYGRKAAGRPASAAPVVERTWLAPPRRGPLAAIVWQQARLSAPLAVLLAVAILGTAVIFACYAGFHEPNIAISVLVEASFASWAAMGFFAAIPAGIAVFLEDLQPQLHSFWRSRPVSVDRWFAAKFLTGLLIPTFILPLPVLGTLVLSLAVGEKLPPEFSEAAWAGAGYLVAHIGLFCTSVLMIILVRQAAYASILAVAAVGLFMAGMQFMAPHATNPILVGAAAVATVGVTLLAWLALRNDWGWAP